MKVPICGVLFWWTKLKTGGFFFPFSFFLCLSPSCPRIDSPSQLLLTISSVFIPLFSTNSYALGKWGYALEEICARMVYLYPYYLR
ncbi:hypothetical protein V8F33_006227 [Rhypophila sp. PSN 637]